MRIEKEKRVCWKVHLKKKAKTPFWGHSQLGPYILVEVNFVSLNFNLQSIWFLLLTH